MRCFVCHHYTRCFCRYMRCVLHYDEVMISGVWVGTFEKSTMQWAPILRIRHYVSVLSAVVFSWSSLRIECTKFGGEAPKKLEGTCGAPIFFIPQSVLGDLLQEGFTIKEISSILAVSESTVYRTMRQYRLSKFEFTDISDKDLGS